MRFSLNRLPTPIGDLLIVFDEEERLRALDWEDYEDRMRRLLRLQYRAEVSLQAGGAPKRIRDALQILFCRQSCGARFYSGKDRRHTVSAQALDGFAQHSVRTDLDLRR